VEFPDAQPYVDKNDRTLIPVRFVTESMGAEVSWNNYTNTATITKDDTTVKISIGSKTLYVVKGLNTSTVTMDTAAVLSEDRTYVPIRFVAEALGAYVDYSDLYNAVEIVMSEDLSAEEIARLRSYDMVQTWTLTDNTASKYNNKENLIATYPELASLNGKYWFSNSHLYLISCGYDTVSKVKNYAYDTVAPVGTNALDYSDFAVSCAKGMLELKYEFDSSGVLRKLGIWADDTADVSFRTDESLSYQTICPAQAYINVRGIIDVTYTDNTNLSPLTKTAFTKKFGIEDPVDGETYSLDVDIVVAIDALGYLDIVYAYQLDTEDGTPLRLKSTTNQT
jgi:hypothetical protein